MGVTMMAGTLGWIIDAPAATAYAVLPVGVETIKPNNKNKVLLNKLPTFELNNNWNILTVLEYREEYCNDQNFEIFYTPKYTLNIENVCLDFFSFK